MSFRTRYQRARLGVVEDMYGLGKGGGSKGTAEAQRESAIYRIGEKV